MKFHPLALFTLLMAASTVTAGEYRYSYDNTLASCGCNGHSWKNGCCEREASCCDHLWDGYCSGHCSAIRLPLPIVPWHTMHMNAPPYQVPCVRLPSIHQHGDCAEACTAAPECAGDCTASGDCCGHDHSLKSMFSQLKSRLHRGYHDCLGCDSGCDSPCGCTGSGMSGDAIDHAAPDAMIPENEVPLPPAPTTESRDSKGDDKKNDKNKKDRDDDDDKKKDNKTAGLWLFPNLSF